MHCNCSALHCSGQRSGRCCGARRGRAEKPASTCAHQAHTGHRPQCARECAQTRACDHHPAANANQEANKNGPEIVDFRPVHHLRRSQETAAFSLSATSPVPVSADHGGTGGPSSAPCATSQSPTAQSPTAMTIFRAVIPITNRTTCGGRTRQWGSALSTTSAHSAARACWRLASYVFLTSSNAAAPHRSRISLSFGSNVIRARSRPSRSASVAQPTASAS